MEEKTSDAYLRGIKSGVKLKSMGGGGRRLKMLTWGQCGRDAIGYSEEILAAKENIKTEGKRKQCPKETC